MRSFSLKPRQLPTVVALSALLALGACGKKVDDTAMPTAPANTAPMVTTQTPGTSGSSVVPLGASSGSAATSPPMSASAAR